VYPPAPPPPMVTPGYGLVAIIFYYLEHLGRNPVVHQ